MKPFFRRGSGDGASPPSCCAALLFLSRVFRDLTKKLHVTGSFLDGSLPPAPSPSDLTDRPQPPPLPPDPPDSDELPPFVLLPVKSTTVFSLLASAEFGLADKGWYSDVGLFDGPSLWSLFAGLMFCTGGLNFIIQILTLLRRFLSTAPTELQTCGLRYLLLSGLFLYFRFSHRYQLKCLLLPSVWMPFVYDELSGFPNNLRYLCNRLTSSPSSDVLPPWVRSKVFLMGFSPSLLTAGPFIIFLLENYSPEISFSIIASISNMFSVYTLLGFAHFLVTILFLVLIVSILRGYIETLFFLGKKSFPPFFPIGERLYPTWLSLGFVSTFFGERSLILTSQWQVTKLRVFGLTVITRLTHLRLVSNLLFISSDEIAILEFNAFILYCCNF